MRTTRPIAAVSALLCAGALAQDFASVSGIIVDYSAPLAGVHVRLTGGWETHHPVVYGAVSDQHGRFSITGILPGNYAARPDESVRNFFVPMLKGDNNWASNLTLKAGDRIEGLLLHMGRGGVITGRVIGDDGEPIEAARVLAVPAEQTYSATVPHAGWDSTDDRGMYRLMCSPGKYRVSVEPPRLDSSYEGDVRADGEDFDYGKTYSDTLIEVKPDSETGGIDIRLIHTPAPTPKSDPLDDARLEGRVIDYATGKPLSHARVTLRPGYTEGDAKLLGPSDWLMIQRMRTHYAVTKADGKFTMTELVPGRYYAYAHRPGFLGGNIFQATMCELKRGEKAMLVLKLSPAATISGRVVDENGNPPPRVNVYATGDVQGDPSQWLFAGHGGGVLTDENGVFRIHGLAGGRFRVHAVYDYHDRSGTPPETPDGKTEIIYAPTFYPSTTNEAYSPWVHVPAGGETDGIAIRLVRAPMLHLSGRVTCVGGAPRPARVEMLAQDSSFVGEVQLPTEGAFTFWRLMPGRYQVIAYSEGEPWNRRTASVKVEIEDHSVEGVELSIVPFVNGVGRANH